MPAKAKRKRRYHARFSLVPWGTARSKRWISVARARPRPDLVACRIPNGYDGGDPDQADFYAERRHLAAALDPILGVPDFRHVIEMRDLRELIYVTLQRIYDRDGRKIFNEVAEDILDHATDTIALIRRRKPRNDGGRGLPRLIVPSITG